METKEQNSLPEDIKIKIFYEDENILIIDKPAGLVIQPEQSKKSITLIDLVLQLRPEIKNVGEDPERPGLVHRLDKETSGLIVLAKNNKVFQELKNKFQNREIKKTYIALVFGTLKEKKGIINKPIGRAKSRIKQTTQYIFAKERPAVTEYQVIKEYKQFSLVKVFPKTGRMHQIRVHFASIGHPVANDKVYSFKNQPAIKNLDRHFLHAGELEFQLFEKIYSFESDLPSDLKNVLEKLEDLETNS